MSNQPSILNRLRALLLVTAVAAAPQARSQDHGSGGGTPPPSISPASTSLNLGDPLTLFVIATPPPLTYQWRLNGANIPGETGSTLVIGSVGFSDFGEYRVLLTYPGAAILSDPASVTINAPYLPPAALPNDNFDDAYDISTTSPPLTSSNASATREDDEPDHAGKRGTNSVWYQWSTPRNGIATFETTGSSFDTLLAVYTGSLTNKLQPVASNDDITNRFFTSAVQFNAKAGTDYLIAIDSLGLHNGPFILNWTIRPTSDELPVITAHPVSRSVPLGGSTLLSVTVSPSSPLTSYQWYFNRRPISGETSSTLTLANVQRENVGEYFVRVRNSAGLQALSETATVEVGPDSRVFSYNKLDDLRDVVIRSGVGAGGGFAGDAPPAATMGAGGGIGLTPGFVSISMGTLGQQILNNTNSTVENDSCLGCDLQDNASRWYGLEPEQDGILTIDTVGSDVDTILAVYLDVSAFQFCASLQACDTNGAPNGVNSMLSFFAHKGTRYVVGVDSQSQQEGLIHLNYQLCVPAAPFSMKNDQFILETTPPDEGLFTYRWEIDGAPLGITESPSINIGPITATPHNYSVTASNQFLTAVTNLGKILKINYDYDHDLGEFHVVVPVLAGSPYRIEEAYPDLTDCHGNWLWLPLTDQPTAIGGEGQTVTYGFPIDSPRRYFRLRPLPPPLP